MFIYPARGGGRAWEWLEKPPTSWGRTEGHPRAARRESRREPPKGGGRAAGRREPPRKGQCAAGGGNSGTGREARKAERTGTRPPDGEAEKKERRRGDRSAGAEGRRAKGAPTPTALPVAPAAKRRGAATTEAAGDEGTGGDPSPSDEAGGDPRGGRESKATRRSPKGENQPPTNKQRRRQPRQTEPDGR